MAPRRRWGQEWRPTFRMANLPPLSRIDRASELRRQTSRLMAAPDDGSRLLVPVWRDQNILELGPEPRATLPTVGEASSLIDAASEIVWLGKVSGRDCFALDLSDEAEPLGHPAISGR